MPTPLRTLLLTFILGGLLGYALAVVSERLSSTSSAPLVQWTSVVALVAVAVANTVLAWWTHRTVHRERRRMDPHRAVSFLLFGKASSVAGAFVAGGYAGFALHFVDRLDAAAPRERLIRSVAAAVAGVAIVISALLLERACRIPEPPDE